MTNIISDLKELLKKHDNADQKIIQQEIAKLVPREGYNITKNKAGQERYIKKASEDVIKKRIENLENYRKLSAEEKKALKEKKA